MAGEFTMERIEGTVTTAISYAKTIDAKAREQIHRMCSYELTKGSRVRIMPDVHAGKGCTIGTTMTITDKAVPNIVGVDIGCGMYTINLGKQSIDFARLDEAAHIVPSGMNVWPEKQADFDLQQLYCHDKLKKLSWIACSIGTLGGGNHFIEVDKDDEGNLYIVVHSGSRHLGVEVASYYQEAGYKVLNRTDDASLQTLVAQMKAEGREKEIQKELKKLKNIKQTSIPKALAYVSGELFEQYIHDMKIVQHFAMLNRQAMMDEIIKGMKLHVEEQFTTIHNYIDTDAMILRKGAVSAKEGEQLLIPINMRDGSLLCVGKGNEDWNCSAPHGAGRLMSRADAKQSFTVSEFKKQMAEVYTTSVNKATLDECPMAYKGMQDILDNIGPTADVVKVIRPIYNFKAGDEE
jgi:tRNA-splicing ligase RtcB